MTEHDDLVAHAMEQGWIEPVFNDGEILIRVVPDDNNPLWQLHLREIDDDVAQMIEKGWIQAEGVDENGEVNFELTELGREMLDI